MKTTPERVTTHRRIGTGTVARVLAGGIAAGAVVGLFATAGPASANPDKVHKSYVCKYVDKPGEDERLQTGQNPIWVDNHALFRSNEAYDAADGMTVVGQKFNDRQEMSVVIVANTGKMKPEPSVEDCPPVTPPTTTTTTTKPPTKTTTTTTPPTTTTTTTVTATLIPPTTTTSTTSSSSTTSTTPVTPAATTTTTPATAASLYPLQPVKAGVNSDGTTREVVVTPLRAALVLLVLFGLWVAFGGRRPHLRRLGSPRDGS